MISTKSVNVHTQPELKLLRQNEELVQEHLRDRQILLDQETFLNIKRETFPRSLSKIAIIARVLTKCDVIYQQQIKISHLQYAFGTCFPKGIHFSVFLRFERNALPSYTGAHISHICQVMNILSDVLFVMRKG